MISDGRALPPLLAAAVLVVLVYATHPNFHGAGIERPGFFGGDFIQEWTGAYIVLEGDAGSLYDWAYAQELQRNPAIIGIRVPEDQYFPMVYPPFYYLLLAPLAALPLRAAAWLWVAAILAAFAAACILFARWGRRYTRHHGRPPSAPLWTSGSRLLWAVPIAVLFLPFLVNLRASQKATFLLLILVGVLIAFQRNRRFLAGGMVGLLAFKPQLLPVFAAVLGLKGGRPFVAGLSTSLGGLALLSLLVGVEPSVDFLRFLTQAGSYPDTPGYPQIHAHSLYGFGILVSGNQTDALAMALAAGGALLTAGLLALLFRGHFDTTSSFFPCQFAGLVAAALLLSPHVLTYDLTLLLVALGCVVAYLMARYRRPAASPALSWSVLLLWTLAGLSPRVAGRTGIQVSTLLMLGLLAVLVLERRNVSASVAS